MPPLPDRRVDHQLASSTRLKMSNDLISQHREMDGVHSRAVGTPPLRCGTTFGFRHSVMTFPSSSAASWNSDSLSAHQSR